MSASPPARRAPRLGPGGSIAGHITRHGRFARIDPRRGRPLPAVSHWLATVGWALLLAESFRRARAALRTAGDADEGSQQHP